MTNEEIDALPAGRELDKLVAELITKPSFEGHPMFTGDWSADRLHVHLWKDLNHRLLLPFYSTDIAAAWTVVEKFGSYKLNSTYFADKPHVCDLTSAPGAPAEQWGVGWGPTASLAICRAALKAVTSTEPDEAAL